MVNTAVLIDANVILDYVASREPYYREAYEIMELCYRKKVQGYPAFHSVSIIWYTLRRFLPEHHERRLWLRKILQVVRVTGASHEEIVKAVEMEDFKDLEDCLQYKCAETVHAQYIITNNVKDFKESAIMAVTPAEFCKLIKK